MKEYTKFLKKIKPYGFQVVRANGSHVFLRDFNGKTITVSINLKSATKQLYYTLKDIKCN